MALLPCHRAGLHGFNGAFSSSALSNSHSELRSVTSTIGIKENNRYVWVLFGCLVKCASTCLATQDSERCTGFLWSG